MTVGFGTQIALSDVSLELRSGEIVGLIGPNGAGKSTLIDVITGFQRPRAGDVVAGRPSESAGTGLHNERAWASAGRFSRSSRSTT